MAPYAISGPGLSADMPQGSDLGAFSPSGNDPSSTDHLDDSHNGGMFEPATGGGSSSQAARLPVQIGNFGAQLALPLGMLRWASALPWFGGRLTQASFTSATSVGASSPSPFKTPTLDLFFAWLPIDRKGVNVSFLYPLLYGYVRTDYQSLFAEATSDISSAHRKFYHDGDLDSFHFKFVSKSSSKDKNFNFIMGLPQPLGADVRWLYRSSLRIEENNPETPAVYKPVDNIHHANYIDTHGTGTLKKGSARWFFKALKNPEKYINSGYIPLASPETRLIHHESHMDEPYAIAPENFNKKPFQIQRRNTWQMRRHAITTYWHMTVRPFLNHLFSSSWAHYWSFLKINFKKIWQPQNDIFNICRDKIRHTLPGGLVSIDKFISRGVSVNIALVESLQKNLFNGLKNYVSALFRYYRYEDRQQSIKVFYNDNNLNNTHNATKSHPVVNVLYENRTGNRDTATFNPSQIPATPSAEKTSSTNTKASIHLKKSHREHNHLTIADPLVRAVKRNTRKLDDFTAKNPVSAYTLADSQNATESFYRLCQTISIAISSLPIAVYLETTTEHRDGIVARTPLSWHLKANEKSYYKSTKSSSKFHVEKKEKEEIFCHKFSYSCSSRLISTDLNYEQTEYLTETTSNFKRNKKEDIQNFDCINWAYTHRAAQTDIKSTNKRIQNISEMFFLNSDSEKTGRSSNHLDPLHEDAPTTGRVIKISGSLTKNTLHAVGDLLRKEENEIRIITKMTKISDKSVEKIQNILNSLQSSHITPGEMKREKRYSQATEMISTIIDMQTFISESDEEVNVLAFLSRCAEKIHKNDEHQGATDDSMPATPTATDASEAINTRLKTPIKKQPSALFSKMLTTTDEDDKDFKETFLHKSAWTKKIRHLEDKSMVTVAAPHVPKFLSDSSVYKNVLEEAYTLINTYADGQSYIEQTDSMTSISRRWQDVTRLIDVLNKTRQQYLQESHIKRLSSDDICPKETYLSQWNDVSLRIHRLLWPKETIVSYPGAIQNEQLFLNTFLDAPIISDFVYPLVFFLGAVEDLALRTADFIKEKPKNLTRDQNKSRLKTVEKMECHRSRLLAYLERGLCIQEALYPWPMALPDMNLSCKPNPDYSLNKPLWYPAPGLEEGQNDDYGISIAPHDAQEPQCLNEKRVNGWLTVLAALKETLNDCKKELTAATEQQKKDLRKVKNSAGKDRAQAAKTYSQRYLAQG